MIPALKSLKVPQSVSPQFPVLPDNVPSFSTSGKLQIPLGLCSFIEVHSKINKHATSHMYMSYLAWIIWKVISRYILENSPTNYALLRVKDSNLPFLATI